MLIRIRRNLVQCG